VLVQEGLELFRGNGKVSGIANGACSRAGILSVEKQNLEYLELVKSIHGVHRSKRGATGLTFQRAGLSSAMASFISSSQLLLKGVSALSRETGKRVSLHCDDGIDLYFNTIEPAHVGNILDVADMVISTMLVTPSMLLISLWIERVAGNGHDIQVLPILVHPLLSDLGSIADDGGGLQQELLLAEFEYFANIFCVEEWLAPADIEFQHAGLGEESQAMFCFFEGKNKCVGGSVETEGALIVAPPIEI